MTKKKDSKLLVARFLQERSNLIHENLKLKLRIEALEKKLTLTDVSQELKDKYHEDFDVFIEANKFKRINYNVFLAQNGEYWIREEVDILMEDE